MGETVIIYILTGILAVTAANGYLQLLAKKGHLPEQDREYLDIAIKKIMYLKLLSDDFFEISSIEAKEEELEPFPINVRNFLSDCILQQYAWMEQQKLQTDFQLPGEDVFLETNEHYLKRIIENIFSNIRKYVKSYVGVKLICEKEQLMVVMENDLKEMDGIDTNRVFEAFYRGNARNNEGSGLGLYVVKCLAKRLGYEVCAECQKELFQIKVIV